MPEQTFLARLVVVRRNEERAICAQFFGCFCVGDGVMRRVGTRSGEHLTTFLCGRDRKPDQLFTFLV